MQIEGLTSATPILTTTGGNDVNQMWNNPFMMLIWLAFLGGGFGGFGGFGGAGAAAAAAETGFTNEFLYSNLIGGQRDLSSTVNYGFSGLNTAISNVGATVERGIADSTYALGSAISGVGTNLERAITSSTFGINDSIKDGFYGLQGAIDACCCNTKNAVIESGYRNDIAIQSQTSALLEAGARNTQAILDRLSAAEMRELQAANSALQTQLSACGTRNAINEALAPVIAQLATVTKNPTPAVLVGNPGCVAY